MKEDKLGDLSMELSVEVLKLTKESYAQSTKPLSQIKSSKVRQVFAQILPRVNMLIAVPILLQSLKLRSKKQTKRANGLKCFGEANI